MARRQKQVEAFYDQDANTYQERRWFCNPVSLSNYRMTRSALFDVLLPAAGDRILEFGCGPGTWTREVAATGASVTAVDISEQMLAQARAYTSGLAVTFAKADFSEFQPDGVYDKVFGVRVFEHFPDKLHVLRTVYSFLRPDGRLVLITKTVPSIWNGRVRLLRTVRRLRGRTPRPPAPAAEFWMERITPWRLQSLMKSVGFEQVRMSPVIVRLPVMARGEDEYPIIFPPLEQPLLRFSEATAQAIRRGPGVLRWAGLFFSESYLATGVRPEVI